jgi:hypothetical protein
MTIVGDVFKELLGMTSTLFLIGIVGALVSALRIDSLVAGSVLLLGCLAILVGTTIREATTKADR